jgi:hypothetical protein
MVSESTVMIIFCADPLNGRQPDSAYAAEVAAVQALGVAYDLISYESLRPSTGRKVTMRGQPRRSNSSGRSWASFGVASSRWTWPGSARAVGESWSWATDR